MARMDYPEVTPDETEGRKMAERLGDAARASGTSVTELDYDTEEMVAEAGALQAEANRLRELASKAREITQWAHENSADFKSEYQPEGAYDATYALCGVGADEIETQVNKAADALERWAQGLVWSAQNWEETQNIASANTDAIDADVSGDVRAGSGEKNPTNPSAGGTPRGSSGGEGSSTPATPQSSPAPGSTGSGGDNDVYDI